MRRALLGALLWALLGALWLGGGPGGGPGGPRGVAGCVLCDPAAAAALGELLGPFLTRSMPHEPAMRGRLGTLMLKGVLGLARLPRDPESFMGVIDQATLDEASIHFRRTLAKVMAQDIRDEKLYQELLWAMREIKDDFERLMKRFQSQVYCINKCGRMEVLWIECIFCNLTHFACNRGVDCGEKQLWVEEGQDLVLDCALPWHGGSHGAKTYNFYRGLAPTEGGPKPAETLPQKRAGVSQELSRPPPAERLLRSSADPVLVWKEAAAAAGGHYRCEMLNPYGELGSELRFNVTVVPLPRVPEESWPPPQSRPGGLSAAAVAAIAVTTIATVLVAAGISWFCFRRGAPQHRRDPQDLQDSPQIKES